MSNDAMRAAKERHFRDQLYTNGEAAFEASWNAAIKAVLECQRYQPIGPCSMEKSIHGVWINIPEIRSKLGGGGKNGIQ